MRATKVDQSEFDRVLHLVEEKTCFRYTAGTLDASSAFMVPVAGDGETVMGPCVEFSWKQLKALAALPYPPGWGR
jgi:hypothetical protein